jgi:alkanesulfonate monooxygenase SsuD/methylene tetrahydromethanopterin reductase-like flavin-dependent oxidoreductase (luciferase family)
MRVGISLTSFHQVGDVREGARWMVERAAVARDAELDSLFVGDHHTMPAPYYQNVPIMARMLAEWDDRPAGCLFLLPLWHPVLLAEQVGTLASIAEGRFIVQCALGDGRKQFAAMGVPLGQRPSRFEESLDIMRRLLAGETVSADGRWTFANARIAPRPPERVEFWVGASAEVAIDRAARLGDGWLAAPGLTYEDAAIQLETYRRACAANHREPTAVAIRRDVYIGESAEEARAVAEPIVAAGYRGFDPGATVFGSVDEVAAQFKRYAALGYTDVIVRHLTDDQGKVLGSIRRLREVRAALTEGK